MWKRPIFLTFRRNFYEKNYKSSISSSITFALCLALCAGYAANSTVSAEENTLAENTSYLPDWVPKDYIDAIRFTNNHGSTYVQDDFVCVVMRKELFYNDKYSYELIDNGSTTDYSEDIVFHDEVFFEMPEAPDQSDKEAYSEYTYLLSELYIHDIIYRERKIYPIYSFDITVYRPTKSGILNLSKLVSQINDESVIEKVDYNFEINDNKITETDVFSWLPDCENGRISVHDGYIVYCDYLFSCANLNWDITQKGTGRIKETTNVCILPSSVECLPPGSSPCYVFLYEPAVSGTVKMTWAQYDKDNIKEHSDIRAEECYKIDSDGTITTIDENDVEYPLLGDCNNDNSVKMTDVITLQKYIIGKSNIKSIVNADCNEDGKINVFDLSTLKVILTS